MGKISNYASALKAKLTDYFVIASNNNGVLETKKVTTEQIGDAVASDQVHSSLNTSDKTLIGGINEVNSNVGTLSSLTTSDKSSLVGAVNEVNGKVGTLFKLGTFTKTYSIGANNSTNFDNSFITVPTGYKIGALLGSGTGNANCYFVNCRPSDSGAYAFFITNKSVSNLSDLTCTCYVLFVREDTIST